MKKLALSFALLALLTVTVSAQEADESCSKDECCGSCPVSAAMDKLPKMTFKVGEESTCCSASAAALAKEHDSPIHFVVAEKEYSDKGEAMTALADETESFVSGYFTPHTCSVSGTTTLAGKPMQCSDSAGALAKDLKSAMDNIRLAYMVGDESCSCPDTAKSLADANNEEIKFVVGEESTCCSVDARIKVAHAKFRAALEELAKADKEAETAGAES